MKINFTKKEYSLLLDMLYLSGWVMNSYEEETGNNEYKALRKRIMSHFKEMNAENKIEYSREYDDYYELDSFHAEINETFISPFENIFFWEELINRLGARDLIESIGADAYKALSLMERAERLFEAQNKYRNEFEKSGLQNLMILTETRD